MVQKIIIITLFSTFLISEALSQTEGYNVPSRKTKKQQEVVNFDADFQALFSFSYTGSSGYYNNNGKLITQLEDTTTYPDFKRTYTFDLKRFTFNFEFEYYPTEKLVLQAKMPLTIYDLQETFLEDVDTVNLLRYLKSPRASLSQTQLDYIALGGVFSLFDSTFINRYSAEIRLPFGTTEGVRYDPQALWSDGAFELLTGMTVGYSGTKSTIELGAKYNYRSEDMTDRIIATALFAVHTVPDTKFYGFAEAAFNLEKGDPTAEFNIRNMPWQDEYFDLGFGFEFIYGKQYLGDFSYVVRLDGKNTWNEAAYLLKFAYRF